MNNSLDKQLVSFGNSLLNRVSTDRLNSKLDNLEVTHVDLENWKEFSKLDHTYYPSKYAIGDIISVDFYDSGFIREAKIIKVHFTESKVLYDVEICIKKFSAGENNMYTRLYNLDSILIKNKIE